MTLGFVSATAGAAGFSGGMAAGAAEPPNGFAGADATDDGAGPPNGFVAVCGFWAAAGAGTGAGTGAGAPVAYGLDGGGAGAFPPHPARAAAVKTIDTTT